MEEVKYKDFLLQEIGNRDIDNLSIPESKKILEESIYKYYLSELNSKHIQVFVNTVIEYFGENNVDVNKDNVKDSDTFWHNICENSSPVSLLPNLFNGNYASWEKIILDLGIDESSLRATSVQDVIKGVEYYNFNYYHKVRITLINAVLNGDIDIDFWHINALTRYYNYILIKFDKIRVTSKEGNFTDIYDTFIKIYIDLLLDGVNFTLIRSSFTTSQLKHAYIHSHAPRLSTNNYDTFVDVCRGSSSTPINKAINNIRRLGNTLDVDIEKVQIATQVYCTELVRFLETESKEGGPYIYLEDISDSRTYKHKEFKYCGENCNLPKKEIDGVFEYFITHSKNLKFAYNKGAFTIGNTLPEYMIEITNSYIDYINFLAETIDTLNPTLIVRLRNLLRRGYITGDSVVYLAGNEQLSNSWSSIEGRTVLKFKGEEVPFTIIDTTKDNKYDTRVILEFNTAMYILTKLLLIINVNYGKESKHKQSKETNNDFSLKWESASGSGEIPIEKEEIINKPKYCYII